MKLIKENCILFKNLSCNDIDNILKITKSKTANYEKNSYIFNSGDYPNYLYILLDGQVILEKTNIDGKKLIMNTFEKQGTVFGEVFVILKDQNLPYSCLSNKDTKVLQIPRNFFKSLEDYHIYYNILTQNLMEILAKKAFHLNQKIEIHSSFSLRQKISNYLLQLEITNNKVNLGFNRESLADYIGTTRPSLSRELINMENDGLIKVDGNIVELLALDKIRDLI